MAQYYEIEVEINSSAISFERLDGEVVIISFETGKYFNSNGSAADLLYLIEQGVPQNNWEAILANSFSGFEMDSHEMQLFLKQLVDEKIVLAGASPSTLTTELPADYARTTWVPPHLRVFDDLADLLLIDPIHDTSVEGWPTTPRG